MALSATQHIFDVEVADIDRGAYASLTVQAALHPSESGEHLVARVLAFALEHQEGIAFGRGVSSGEPAISVRDLTGQLQVWIEVGTPDAERLHKASKAADRVVVYCHKEPGPWKRGLAGQNIHGRAKIEVILLEPALVGWIVDHADRRTTLSLTVTGDEIFVEIGGESRSAAFVRATLDAA